MFPKKDSPEIVNGETWSGTVDIFGFFVRPPNKDLGLTLVLVSISAVFVGPSSCWYIMIVSRFKKNMCGFSFNLQTVDILMVCYGHATTAGL